MYYAVSLYTSDGLENNTERHSTEQYGSYQILFFFLLIHFWNGKLLRYTALGKPPDFSDIHCTKEKPQMHNDI